MRTLFVGLALLILAACVPFRYTEVDVVAVDRPQPWYESCTWDYPCEYGDRVYVYSYGYFWRPWYHLYMVRPEMRHELRRSRIIPPLQPRNRSWDRHEPERRHDARPENRRERRREQPKRQPERRHRH